MSSTISKSLFVAGLLIAILASTLASTVISTQLMSVGHEGAQGAKGDTGDTGKSAYQLWLENGNVGTVQDFLDSLKGDQGEQGLEGPQGPPGVNPWENSSVSISPLTFRPADILFPHISNMTYVSITIGLAPFWAPVQLPHGVYLVNMTAFLVDTINYINITCELWRYNPRNGSLQQMASVQTTYLDSSPETFILFDDMIEYGQIDNENYVYALKSYNSENSPNFNAIGLRGVIIEYVS